MEVSISQFRRELFSIVAKAMAGEPVIVKHKTGKFRIVPEPPVDRLSRLTPMQIINPDVGEEAEERLKEEMQREWEEDWKYL